MSSKPPPVDHLQMSTVLSRCLGSLPQWVLWGPWSCEDCGIRVGSHAHLLTSSLVGILLGASDCSFPLWLKSLMTICCCVKDCSLQNIAIATLLEVINHSQSLALVIDDKMKRYKTSGNNPFFGKLQMVTVPPIAPGILKVIAEKTDFYQVSPLGMCVGSWPFLSPKLLTGKGVGRVQCHRGLEGLGPSGLSADPSAWQSAPQQALMGQLGPSTVPCPGYGAVRVLAGQLLVGFFFVPAVSCDMMIGLM